MAVEDEATMIPAVGHFFLAPSVDQALPADLLAPTSPYVDLGHTALDDPFGITSEGGERETKGTWQNKNLRSTTSPRQESIVFVAQQWTVDNYKLFWGSNAATVGGFVQVPKNPLPTLGTMYVLLEDGAEQVPWHFPKVEISRADDIELSAEDLGGLPLRAVIIERTAADWLYQVAPKADYTDEP